MTIDGRYEYYTNFTCNRENFFHRACFSAIFNEDFEKIAIHIAKDPNFGHECKGNHYLLFDKQGINRHLRCLKQVIPSLKYEIKSSAVPIGRHGSNIDCYTIELTLKGCQLEKKYALTWVRYLYEYPYNIILKEAYRLKDYKAPFKRMSIPNLYLLCATAFPEYIGIGHSIVSKGYMVSNNTLKINLHKVECLNNLYEFIRFDEIERLGGILPASHKNIHNTSFWENNTAFKKRADFYKHKVLPIIKPKKIEQ